MSSLDSRQLCVYVHNGSGKVYEQRSPSGDWWSGGNRLLASGEDACEVAVRSVRMCLGLEVDLESTQHLAGSELTMRNLEVVLVRIEECEIPQTKVTQCCSEGRWCLWVESNLVGARAGAVLSALGASRRGSAE